VTSEHPEEWEPLEEQLREKIREWREQAELCADESRGPMHGSEYGNGVSAGLNECADEIEELIK
jgi:hypothetical protein